MTSLVVTPTGSTAAFSGAGPLEDLEGLCDAIADGDWLAAALNAGTLAVSTAAAIVDPIGTALAAGVGWVIDHLNPLKDWLEKITGDADAVAAFGGTWHNIAGRLDTCTTEIETARLQVATLQGAFATTYRLHLDGMQKVVKSQARASGAISTGMQIASGVVAFVYGFVRDLIAAIIGKAIAWVAETVFTLGLGLPGVIGQVATTVADYATRAATKINALIDAMGNLRSLLNQVHGIAESVGKTLEDVGTKLLRRTDAGRGVDAVEHAVRRGAESLSTKAVIHNLTHHLELGDAEFAKMLRRLDASDLKLAEGVANALREGANPVQILKLVNALRAAPGGEELLESLGED